MNLRSQKQLAARVLKCGVSRVRIKAEKEVEEAITREDIRNLIKKNLIWKIQKRGQVRAQSRLRLAQRKKGRKKGFGSKKGKAGARNSGKRHWIRTIRSVRKALKKLKETGAIENRLYRRLYLMAKGGTFKSRRHLLSYLKEHELLKMKERKPVKKVKKPAKPIKKVKRKPAKKKPATAKRAKKAAKKQTKKKK